MCVTLGVSEPKQLAIAWTQLRKRWSQKEFRFAGSGGTYREVFFGGVFNGGRVRTAPVIAQQVTGDAEEITSRGNLTVESDVSAEEADIAFLGEVVGESVVGGDARQISPKGPGRALIKAGKSLVIHVSGEGRAGGPYGVAGEYLRNCGFERHRFLLPHFR